MTTLMVIIFIIGYLMIALEHPLKLNKAGVAILMGCILWVVYRYAFPSLHLAGMEHVTDEAELIQEQIAESVGDIWQTLLLLLGAMTIVQLIDIHGGFSYVAKVISTKNKVKLLWAICLFSFFLSAILDNMTTTIVMVMILRRLIAEKEMRWLYGGFVVVAANAGGAFSPIGDVTTIMLWAGDNVTSSHIIPVLFIPSLASLLVPLIIISFFLKGNVGVPQSTLAENASATERQIGELQNELSDKDKIGILIMGVLCLVLTPVFKSTTHLPPFMGILTGVGLMWVITDRLYYHKRHLNESLKMRISRIVQTVDLPTILFFFGILMAVKTLSYSHILHDMAKSLEPLGLYGQNILIGVASSIVDNVPLVAAAMNMHPIIKGAVEPYCTDGYFWDLLAYCAGTGGSMLIIGSAAGVAFMGLEHISFGWYMKRITPLAVIGFLAGVATFFIQAEVFGIRF